jgi:uncharacterized protein (TIGR03437 family)
VASVQIIATGATGSPASIPVTLVVTAAPVTITAVFDSASFQPGISPGAWISVFGTSLAQTTRVWRGSEIIDGRLPTQLDGVSVTINNRPTAIHYISPGQLNVQAPTDVGQGSQVPLRVTTPQGSATTSVVLRLYAPAFFMLDPDNRKYIAAQHADYSLVGRTGLYPTSTPARPGEVILLYGSGFGATNPAVPAGQAVTQPAPLADKVVVHIGGVEAEVRWAGLGGAGLNQLNVKVPDSLPDGDARVVAEIGGFRTQDNASITVRR